MGLPCLLVSLLHEEGDPRGLMGGPSTRAVKLSACPAAWCPGESRLETEGKSGRSKAMSGTVKPGQMSRMLPYWLQLDLDLDSRGPGQREQRLERLQTASYSCLPNRLDAFKRQYGVLVRR